MTCEIETGACTQPCHGTSRTGVVTARTGGERQRKWRRECCRAGYTDSLLSPKSKDWLRDIARRVRCDEAKPACQRCTSTGRKCEGYAALSSSSSSSKSVPPDHRSAPLVPPGSTRKSEVLSDVSADLSLTVLPRKNTDELGSYRYFLDVAAPCLAGSFDVAFWTKQIPRACFGDPAMWHAVVSLGSVFKTYGQMLFSDDCGRGRGGGCGRGTPPDRDLFALQQFNLSIRHLMADPAPLSGPETQTCTRTDDIPSTSSTSAKWRTLVLCIIYMAICTLEGLFANAHMHFVYGSTMLRELEGEMAEMDKSESSRRGRGGVAGKKMTAAARIESPITFESLRSIMASFELRDKLHQDGGARMDARVHLDSHIYSAWRTYSNFGSPLTGVRDATGQSPNLTVARLAEACKASQALLNSFILVFAEVHTATTPPEFSSISPAGPQASPLPTSASLIDSFFNLGVAVDIFMQEFDAEMALGRKRRGYGKADQLQIQLLLLCLRQSYATNRLMLAQLPSPSLRMDRIALGSGGCNEVLDLTEEILDLHYIIWDSSMAGTISAANVIKPPIMINVFVIAMNASTWAERNRALNILKRPQLEGLLEHAMVTSIVEAMLEREFALTKELRRRDAAAAMATNRGESPPKRPQAESFSSLLPTGDEQGTIDPRAKTHVNKMWITGRREAMLQMWTQQEHFDGQVGSTVRVVW